MPSWLAAAIKAGKKRDDFDFAGVLSGGEQQLGGQLPGTAVVPFGKAVEHEGADVTQRQQYGAALDDKRASELG